MIRSFVAMLALCLSIQACGSEAVPGRSGAEAAAPQVAQTNERQPKEAPPAEPAPVTEHEVEQAAEAQESADGAAQERSDPELARLAAASAEGQQLPGGRWQAGTHYTPITPSQPTSTGPEKVEVLEFFWYACSHCYALEPYLDNWQQKKPAYIELVKVPVLWGPPHRAHARLFYTLEALGRRDLHPKVFEAIHRQNNMLAANDESRTRAMHIEFAKANGISEEAFVKAYDSFGVNSNLQRAEQLMRRYRVQGVPYVIINGKYASDVGKAGGQDKLIQLINDLAAAERRR